MFSTSGLMATTGSSPPQRRLIRHQVGNIKQKTGKGTKKVVRNPSICIGNALHLQERTDSLNPYGYSCSLRCKHPIHIKSRRTSSQGKTDDWIPEDLYKRYTETDSRPASPDNFSRRSVSVPRGHSVSGDYRKCLTPEPDAKQCQFHQRRVLILDLRRVKSVDVITRQNSLTTGTSIDSTYGDDDGDNRSSSANRDSSSLLHQLSPRNLSLSRSTTPKAKARGRKKKSKERSSSPIAYERSSSPKILEGILSNLDEEIEHLHEDLKKYETKFKSSNISMKEDLWLSYPRTWSRGSASFGIPSNSKILKCLEPSEYLRKYVKINESRVHLYNLVFHRHRTIENPTLKDISFKAVKTGISEVLGRDFSEEELNELVFNYIGLESLNGKVDEYLFRGICAFCERVYGSHSLEDCPECHKCFKSNTKDKTRCHWNQQSHLEKADFEYISTKIKNQEIRPNLSNLLKVICEKKND